MQLAVEEYAGAGLPQGGI